jgi:GxxExxY protein
MPIEPSVTIRPISEDEFHLIDHKIMGLVFGIHNELGRFCDEKIYQNELAYRCQKMGLGEIATEVPIRVSYRDFQKIYYIDLLVDRRIMYELKTVEDIIGQHRKQALNYLLLMGMHHGKLINMRPQSVQHYFVSTRLTPQKRYGFTTNDQEWKDLDEDSLWLKDLMGSLLAEWGAFLDTNLFYEAISHFRGGVEHILKKISVAIDSRILGTQHMHLLNPEVAFKISSATKAVSMYERHLQSFLSHTRLRAIQWINFKHDKILFKTLIQ